MCAVAAAVLVGCGNAVDTTTDADDDDGSDADDDGDDGGDAGSTCTSAPPGTNIGAATAFVVGTWKLVTSSKSQNDVIVSQDTNGFFAYSAICTHAGCLVNAPASNGATLCPCHGSRFDGNGNVTNGPAARPLPHYALALCNGFLYVDTSNTVSESTRTPAQ
jgi:thiosulfate dehydrogenase [quinone] large subunit